MMIYNSVKIYSGYPQCIGLSIYIMHGDIAYMIVIWDYQYIMGLI